jgi:acyl-CoA synthetase (AMP-forming)/AMP-acid ligase II
MRVDFSLQFALLAQRFSDREALVNLERERRYSFSELHLLTNRIANLMRDRLGLRQGDVYLCILDNDNLSLLHHWTVFKGEATAAWTNYRDSLAEHLWQTDRVKPKVAFLERALLASHLEPLRERGVEIVCMDPPTSHSEGVHDFWHLVEEASDANPGIQHEVYEDVLLLRFTGGTTGRGKCATYTVDNWLACRDAFYAHPEPLWNSDMRFLHLAPLSHGSGMMVLPCFFRGGCAITQNVPDLGLWCGHVEAERATAAMMVPTLLYRLLDLPEAEKHDLSSLETVLYGAAPMSPDKLRLLQDRFGNVFVQVYGATECCVPITCLGKSDHEGALERPERLASAGRVTPGVELRIVDLEGNPLSANETGEIQVRSRGTIAGYYDNPEQTQAEFAGGFWRSGDLGVIDSDGFVTIVDRKKDMIVSGGFNVYATEVEAALDGHPAVLMSAVVGVPHEEWGEAIHAEVMLKEGHAAGAEELIEHVKARLARFKAPKTVAFISELPLSAAGKVLRRKVREKYWTGRDRQVG